MKKELALKFDALHWGLNEERIDWKQIDQVFENKQDLIESVDFFIGNLQKEHLVPGSVYNQLLGIAHWARTNDFVTPKQQRYTTMAIGSYWDQRDHLNDPWFL